MIKKVFDSPAIKVVSVGFDMAGFDRGLAVAYAYGKPLITCSIKSKDLLIQEFTKDYKDYNKKHNKEAIETSYKGVLIEINDTLSYGEFLVTIPNGEVIIEYKAIMGD